MTLKIPMPNPNTKSLGPGRYKPDYPKIGFFILGGYEVLNLGDRDEWKRAMQKEIDSLVKTY